MSVPYRQVFLGETVGRAALVARRAWRCADRAAAAVRRAGDVLAVAVLTARGPWRAS
jgi:hypothetical protein